MDKKIKIAICGDRDAIEVVRDTIHSIPEFEIIPAGNLWKADVIYWLYGRAPSMVQYFPLWIRKTPLIINHWIGSDVTDEVEIYRHRNRMRNRFRECIYRWKFRRGGLINLVVSPWLMDELSKIQIVATFLPLSTIDATKLGPATTSLEKDIDFLCYALFRRFDFYGGDKIVRLAQSWKKYSFFIFLADMDEIPSDFIKEMPPNITLSPRVPHERMSDFYRRSKFFIRYTEHDGMSLSVLEALYFHLGVLSIHPFPYTQKIESFEKLSEAIPSLVDTWQPNTGGHAYVIEQFSTEAWKENFLAIVQMQLHRPEH